MKKLMIIIPLCIIEITLLCCPPIYSNFPLPQYSPPTLSPPIVHLNSYDFLKETNNSVKDDNKDKEFNDWINPDTKGREFDYQYNDIPPQPIAYKSVKKYTIPYPDSLTKRKIEDGVKFVIYVYKDGVIEKIVYVRPIKSGMGGLSKIALDTIKGWKFKPGTRDGKPVDTSVDITVGFVLEQEMVGKSTDNGLPDNATAKISVVLKKDVKKVKKDVYKVWINEQTKDREFNPPTNYYGYNDYPEPINPVAPEYPPELRRTGIQGTVILELDIFNDGVIRKITVRKSLSDGLDDAAINAIKQWKFKPGKSGGKFIDTTVIIPIEFEYKQK